MLAGGNPLTVGVGIVIEVIRKNNSDYDLEFHTGPTPRSTDPIYLGTLLRQFAINIPSFMHLIKNANSANKELKVAFARKIEPLGFDRFKTCELMAELLHCSNMMLLNMEGSESEIKARDTERQRLKSEGKLKAYADEEESTQEEFGTSVDSSGFHHARAPSFGDVSDKSKHLEVSNGTDEDFENVTASEVLADDVKDDFDEKEAEAPHATVADIEKSMKEIDELTKTLPKEPAAEKDKESPGSLEVVEKLSSTGITNDDSEAPKTPTKPATKPDTDITRK
jgi:SIT4-associating protein SAP185/190